MNIFSVAFSLFLLMDSIGNVPIFLSVLKEIHPKRQRKIIFRELLIALAIIIAFYFLGDGILLLLGVKEHTVRLAGGIILFLIALKMIFPPPKEEHIDLRHEEPFIVPLAIPLIAGPAILAAVMVYSGQKQWLFMMGAIILAWFASTLVLLSAPFLQKILGKRGMMAFERLMGLILILIAIQMFLVGLSVYLNL